MNTAFIIKTAIEVIAAGVAIRAALWLLDRSVQRVLGDVEPMDDGVTGDEPL